MVLRPIPKAARRSLTALMLGGFAAFTPVPDLVAQDFGHVHSDATGDAMQYSPFFHRVEVAPNDAGLPTNIERLPDVPSNFQPWWHLPIRDQVFTDFQPATVDIESLTLEALANSVQIRAYAQEPLIEETRIDEALAAFDWAAFIDNKWTKLSEPVGSSLTVGGGRSRSRTSNMTSAAGIRRRNTLGGEFSVQQQFGFQTSNSTFFTPGNQGNTRMSLSYTQPVLRGAGRTYNRSQIVIAQIGTDAANQRYMERLQTHLLDVTDAYWSLYRSRALLLQRRKLYESAQIIVEQMKRRTTIDSTSDQLIRAEAAATKRLTDLIRSETDVVDAQDRLRNLVNSPSLETDWRMEFLPQDSPTNSLVAVDLQQSLAVALDYRPDILASLQDIKAASVEKFVAESDLLPQLDVVLESYVSGLRGSFDVGNSFKDQFTTGEPSYTIGLNYEMPLGNRAALARDRRASLEIARLQAQFQVVVERVTLEVRTAVRNVETLGREMRARYEALEKAKDEVIYIENRMRLLPSMNKTASLYLENLLTSQERLASAEAEYLESQISYSLALLKLKQVTGTLLQCDKINLGTDESGASEDSGSADSAPVDPVHIDPLPEGLGPGSGEPGIVAPAPDTDRLEGVPFGETEEGFEHGLVPYGADPELENQAIPELPSGEPMPLIPLPLDSPMPPLEPMPLNIPELVPLEPGATIEDGLDEETLPENGLVPLEPLLEEPEPTPIDGVPRPDRAAPAGDLDARFWRAPFQRTGQLPRRTVWE